MQIGNVHAERGSKSSGTLEIGRTKAGFPIAIPLTIVKGMKEGPTLLVRGAAHGEEVLGSLAIVKLLRTLQPEQLSGTFIGVPVTNVPAFERESYNNPMDNGNLFLIWPESKEHEAVEGVSLERKRRLSISQKTAFDFVNEILSKADYFIDIHSGSPKTYGLYTAYASSDKISSETKNKSKEMCLAFGIEEILCKTMEWKTIEEASASGIPTLFLELGGGPDCREHGEDMIEIGIKGIRNVMKHIGLLEGKPEPIANTAKVYDPLARIANGQFGGFWIPSVKPGDTVVKGATMGVVIDAFTGKDLDRIVSPVNGTVLNCGLTYWPLIDPYQGIGYIGKLVETVRLRI